MQIGVKSEGGKKFHGVTRAEAARGQALADAAGKGGSSDVPTVVEFAQHFAIVLDNRLLSTPYIDYKQDPDGIDPTKSGAIISNLPIDQAKGLAIMLRSGALPFHVVIAP